MLCIKIKKKKKKKKNGTLHELCCVKRETKTKTVYENK